MRNPVQKYHPMLVILHWMLAVLIVLMIGFGFLWLAPHDNADPEKLRLLETHMIVGQAILVLTILRYVVKRSTSRPEQATSNNSFIDRIARATHIGFYLIVVLLPLSGLTIAIVAGLNESVFQRSGAALPQRFSDYSSFAVHAALAAILTTLIVLHIAAALYHQFVRKDGLLKRMTLGRKT